jgi:hypothetical protein
MQQKQQLRDDTEILQQQRRRDEYLAAQRAAIESIHVGRATAEVVEQQGEQLRSIEETADVTQFKLDRATRLLKGMTWSGWVSNMFTSDVQPPPSSSSTQPSSSFKTDWTETYESLPETCRSAAQAIKNYQANVSILDECETSEQQQTLKIICDDMYTVAKEQVSGLEKSLPAYGKQLRTDLENIRKQQTISQVRVMDTDTSIKSADVSSGSHVETDLQKQELFGRRPDSSVASNKATNSISPSSEVSASVNSPQQQEQDEHLQKISACLTELGSIANSLQVGLSQQNEIVESIDYKTENVLETSRMVSRRTDRLIQKKSWKPIPPKFVANVVLRHIESGKYLAVHFNELVLCNTYNPHTCQFAYYERQAEIFGLQSLANSKWVGQAWMTGGLAVTAKTFGRREEWQIDHNNKNWDNTRLLCASAGWGHGGYLVVDDPNYTMRFVGISPADGRAAARWKIIISEETEPDTRETKSMAK